MVDWGTACKKWDMHTIGSCCRNVTRRRTLLVYMHSKHVVFAWTVLRLVHTKRMETKLCKAVQIMQRWRFRLLIPCFIKDVFKPAQIQFQKFVALTTFWARKACYWRKTVAAACPGNMSPRRPLSFFSFRICSWITYPAPVAKSK